MESLETSIQKLRQLVQRQVQTNWRIWTGDLPVAAAVQPRQWQTWPLVQLNARSHIDWPAGRQVVWLGQQIPVPAGQDYGLEGLTLRLALRWWADQAQIFVNGEQVQEGDLFDCFTRILLAESAQPGETIAVALRLVSPGHDSGALVYSRLIFEAAAASNLDPGLVADELTVLQGYLSQFQPEKLPILAAAIAEIDWTSLGDRLLFHQSLQRLRDQLQPLGSWLRERQISYLGHAHLDLAWLWPIAETWEVAENTFESVLALQQDFPELIFCHSTPALYAWVETHRPDLFQAIQAQVQAGRWEVAAGLWVEPDFNLIGGESLVRQVLYGQRYVQERFGQVSSVAWLPDSFGFCWQLPQILQQGGVDYFVTQKLRWNDTTQFPYEAFWWRSPDGTSIFSAMLPPIGEGIDPAKMATFAQTWEAATGVPEALWLPGVGDHGGGPTRDMLETARRWQQSPLFPHLQPTSATAWLQRLQAQMPEIPVWNNELYLEFHRGCYTTHADQKQRNRRCESLLYQAELFAAIATLTAGSPYPQQELETAWKQVLFNQFHDILPGSSIPEVFEEANQLWAAAETAGQEILQTAQAAIAAQIALPTPPTPDCQPIVVFNPLNWARSQVVALALDPPLPPGKTWQVYDTNHQPLPCQVRDAAPPQLLFWAAEVPGVGYRVFWLAQGSAPAELETPDFEFVLENACLRVEIDPETGNLARVYDKLQEREVLQGPGNQLQFFQDSGQYWDAWNIDPNYGAHPLPGAELKQISWQTRGPVQQRLRVVRQFNQSQFCQDYVLDADTAILKIETSVDWQEEHVLVKAAFPLTVTAARATYEIPCGAIERPTLPNPEPLAAWEQAKWEVPALQWADLSDPEQGYGASLLNDCKYGYDAQPNQLRLTLLRSSTWPNPEADRGQHQFTYALYPHPGSWQTAQTPHRGYELNQPLQAFLWQQTGVFPGSLPPVGRFLDLGASTLILMAFKQAEVDTQRWVLRCYEAYGETAPLSLSSDLNLVLDQPVNLLEEPLSRSNPGDSRVNPWKIVSLRVKSPEGAD